jgi:hypothetical protein
MTPSLLEQTQLTLDFKKEICPKSAPDLSAVPAVVGPDLKLALLTLLESGGQINMDADLACYSTKDGYYIVEYFLNEETVSSLNLTSQEKKLLKEDEELIEIFDNPEEAVNFYFRLTDGKMIPAPDFCRDKSKPKKNIKNKIAEVKVADKDKYF